MEERALLEQLEDAGAPPAALAWLAAQALELDEQEVNAAVRRALLVHAAGGDLRRDPDPDGRAASTLAADLDPAGLADALAALRAGADGLPAVARALDDMLGDPDRALRLLAAALVADELSTPSDE